MEIRHTTEADLPVIMQIYRRARRFMAEHGNPNQWGPTNWPPEALIRADIAAGSSYVCLHGGRIVGTFFFRWGADPEPSYRGLEDGAWLDDSPYGVIHRIASDGTVKGTGTFCIRWAYEQCGHLRMDTHGDNTVMQNLLRKNGFVLCGVIHVPQDNDPRLAFEKAGTPQAAGAVGVLKTQRLDVAPFDMRYLNEYFRGFNEEITQYQWPDPFTDMDSARRTLQGFLDEMARGETLFFAVLAKDGRYLGSVEVHGLTGGCPELGVWITAPEQGKGYAYEALSAVLADIRAKYHKGRFFYEADIRNAASRKLLDKFRADYEITDRGTERLTTDAGKSLELRGYILQARGPLPAPIAGAAPDVV